MKFILTIAVWIVTAGIVFFFFAYRGVERAETGHAQFAAEREITIDITTTFITAKDHFALDIGEKQKGFTVLLDGKKIYETDSGVTKGVPVELKAVKASDGKHEITVNASPVSDGGANAVRIRALVNGNVVSEDTQWFDDGQEIVAALRFETGKNNGQQ
jgi:hypothetical protein